MHAPLISVVMSTFNGEKFLKQQIDSILAQTYPNIELIISDDASSDNTKKILAEYSNSSNIKIIFREKNAGFSQNFYETALLAGGDFIAFSDQDDIWLPQKIQTLYEALNGFFLVFGNSQFIDEDGNLTGKKLSEIRKMQDVKNTFGFLLENVAWGHTMLIKKELLSYYSILPANVEYDKWLAFLATCLTGIKYVSEPLTLYRQHPQAYTEIFKRNNTQLSKQQEKYNIFKKNLEWIKVMKENPLEKKKDFYEKLYNLYTLKEHQKFVWSLFFFLLKHEKEIFSFRKKSLLSNLFEMRKLSKGVKKQTV